MNLSSMKQLEVVDPKAAIITRLNRQSPKHASAASAASQKPWFVGAGVGKNAHDVSLKVAR
jgi:hypothetical protein